MTISDPANSAQRSLAQDLTAAARYYLGSRTGLIAIAAAALGLGLYFNWGWLAAAGIAPILIAIAPCAVMCALGLCMAGRSRAAGSDQARGDEIESTSNAPQSLHLASPEEDGDGAPRNTVKKSHSGRNHKDCC